MTKLQKCIHMYASIGEIPTSYLDSMTYEEQILWLCNYLEHTVIPAVNQNDATVQQLKQWFETLDVQDEINNKLNNMAEDGSLEEIIGKYLIQLQPNKNFDIKLGTSLEVYGGSEQGIIDKINNVYKYYDNMIQIVHIQYNSNNSSFEIVGENTEFLTNEIQKYIDKGGKIDGIKFHISGTRFNVLFNTYNPETVCNAYQVCINNYIENLSYKNSFNKVWLFNEEFTSNTPTSCINYINNIITFVKNKGYQVSIPFAGVWNIVNVISPTFITNCDFISLNEYPSNDYYKNYSSINQTAERFNKDFNLIETYLKKYNKQLYITEFGCSSSWDSFTTPESYKQDGEGKPISLMIEGFYKSKFIPYLIGANYWYIFDSYTFAPETLLNIKNNGGLRYYGK